MSIKRIANRDARGYVERREPFHGSNLMAEKYNDGTLYVVYSFGTHHPLFVFDENAGQWYENMTYASRTTSKHRTQCRPNGEDIIPLCLNDMKFVEQHGAVGVIMAADARQEADDIRESAVKLMQGINGTIAASHITNPLWGV